ncbi:hypothetical protein NHP190003_16320 (plasmid) [Helicobacter sp. NHP19-003]|uniref:Uncharacterized protein n=1 Tax=Helicobacter gastrocanis TaxID=2849641 RepID=A0ABM7SCD4_9HELI|nr:hypothetical protein NHP190003_16320 [Helicobacter sp. NHP19-003]
MPDKEKPCGGLFEPDVMQYIQQQVCKIELDRSECELYFIETLSLPSHGAEG